MTTTTISLSVASPTRASLPIAASPATRLSTSRHLGHRGSSAHCGRRPAWVSGKGCASEAMLRRVGRDAREISISAGGRSGAPILPQTSRHVHVARPLATTATLQCVRPRPTSPLDGPRTASSVAFASNGHAGHVACGRNNATQLQVHDEACACSKYNAGSAAKLNASGARWGPSWILHRTISRLASCALHLGGAGLALASWQAAGSTISAREAAETLASLALLWLLKGTVTNAFCPGRRLRGSRGS